MELPASASLQPAVDLSLVPPTDNPEAAFDLIAASNLQTEAAPEPQGDVEATEAEEPEVAAGLQEDACDEPKDNEKPEEDSEEEIPLDEVLECDISVFKEYTFFLSNHFHAILFVNLVTTLVIYL